MSNDVVNAILNLQKVLLMHGGNKLNIQIDQQAYINLVEDLHQISDNEGLRFLIINGPMCATKITVTDV